MAIPHWYVFCPAARACRELLTREQEKRERDARRLAPLLSMTEEQGSSQNWYEFFHSNWRDLILSFLLKQVKIRAKVQ
jgi:hypothetical protein